VELPANFNAVFEYNRPRKGNWAYDFSAVAMSGGLAGNDEIGYEAEFAPTYFITDAFSVNAGVYVNRTPDWLVWQHDNLVGSFQGREWHFDAGLDWNIGSRQELRVKLQTLAIDARARQGWRIDQSGNAVASDDPVEDFSVRNLGFQIRYRYELAPLSYLYVVYGRGGYREEPLSEDPLDGLRDSFDLRDDEQLLVKLSYRFEI